MRSSRVDSRQSAESFRRNSRLEARPMRVLCNQLRGRIRADTFKWIECKHPTRSSVLLVRHANASTVSSFVRGATGHLV